MKPLSNLLFVAALLSGTALQAQQTKRVQTGNLTYHVYTAKPQNFGVTSVLIEGKNDLVLIDAQFSKDEALNVVELIKKTNKKLKTVFISHSDPDFYFGLDVINENFPDAKIISTAQTAYMIDETKDEKMGIWGPQLKENAPSKIITPEAIANKAFSIEGIDIEIKQSNEDPVHIYLWIPSDKMILGGVSLFNDAHVWTADSPSKYDRNLWLKKLDEMTALAPTMAIPAHFNLLKDPNLSPSAIEFTKQYIIAFENILDKENKTEKTGEEKQRAVIAHMKSLYPDAVAETNLELSAGVHTGQLKWSVAELFPAVGRKAKVDFGDFSFELNFKDNKHLSFIGKGGSMEGVTDDVVYTAKWIRPQVYMVYWTEPKTKSNVVHVEDYEHNIVYTNISASDGTFTNLEGRLSLLD